jgi:hypothetical protein
MSKTKDPQAKVIISAYGNGIAVGLNGNKAEVQSTYNRFFNWGSAGASATFLRSNQDSEMQNGDLGDSYLHEVSDKFSYFLSTDESMLQAMTAEQITMWQDTDVSSLCKATRGTSKKAQGQLFLDSAKVAATQEYDSFRRENFMQFSKTPTHVYQELDGGSPSWTSETED